MAKIIELMVTCTIKKVIRNNPVSPINTFLPIDELENLSLLIIKICDLNYHGKYNIDILH